MRIAQVSPLFESVPPRYYGGTERVVSYLTEELVRGGHEVTLFASGDSVTEARLIAPCRRSLRLDRGCRDSLAHHFLALEVVARHAHLFDVIHFHLEYLHFPLSRHLALPHLSTLHNRLDLPDLVPLFREYREMPVVAISTAHRQPLPWLNWLGTVHHGIAPGLYEFHPRPGKYLAFLGRISREKGLHRAVRIALEAGRELRVAAKIDEVDRGYFKEAVEPLLKHPLVQYVGEIGEGEKNDFLGNAIALLFPIDWPEPFGLVMVESMACGTPVIAYDRGSVPEVIEEGVSGFVVSGFEEAVRAVEKAARLDRRRCRQAFEARFTSARMARDYLRLYRQVCRSEEGRREAAAPLAQALPSGEEGTGGGGRAGGH